MYQVTTIVNYSFEDGKNALPRYCDLTVNCLRAAGLPLRTQYMGLLMHANYLKYLVYSSNVDVGNFNLIITKLGNNIHKGNYHNTPKFYEGIHSFRVRMGHMNSAMLLKAAKLFRTLLVFQ